MKGVVFNIFEEFVRTGWGDEAYESLLDACPLKTREPFVGPGTYPDSDLMLLVARATEQFSVDTPTALRAFGKFMFFELARKFGTFLEGHEEPKTFLQSVHDVIHVEVRKLHKDAITPSFEYEDPSPDRLIIRYHSARQLCHVMEGLLDGVAEHYGTEIEQRHETCMHSGAPHCEFDLAFAA